MPVKNPKGTIAKVRIRTFVNGKFQRADVISRHVYETSAGWRMWANVDGRSRKVPVRKVDGKAAFECDRHIEMDRPAESSVLIDQLRKQA